MESRKRVDQKTVCLHWLLCEFNKVEFAPVYNEIMIIILLLFLLKLGGMIRTESIKSIGELSASPCAP